MWYTIDDGGVVHGRGEGFEGDLMTAEWIMGLAQAGGVALMGAAATEAWSVAREGFVALFRRGDARRAESLGLVLDEDAATVAKAVSANRDEVRQWLLPGWQTRLVDLLREYPEAADELKAWMVRVERTLPAGHQTWTQSVTASASGAVAQGAMFGNVINHSGGLRLSPPDVEEHTGQAPDGQVPAA
jgi:hypothetical protein